jgi:hypothetical protein
LRKEAILHRSVKRREKEMVISKEKRRCLGYRPCPGCPKSRAYLRKNVFHRDFAKVGYGG